MRDDGNQARARASEIPCEWEAAAWETWAWGGALLLLCGWFAWRIGATHWYTDSPLFLADGRVIRLPDTFSSIDHPVHIAKERAVVDALRGWRWPAWLMSPQGGYPAEFYPLGGAFVVAALYFLFLGVIPVAVVHKLVVIAVFMLPPLAYWLIVRRERLPASIAFLAGFLHLFTRGSWLGGGSRELIDYGLWPNVLAAYLPFFVLIWGADWLRYGSRRGLFLATAAATLALYSNPRSLLGLLVVYAVAIAIGIVDRLHWRGFPRRAAGWRRTHGRGALAASARPAGSVSLRHALLPLLGRVSFLAALPLLLAAALLLPLRAHQDLYRFIRYVDFSRPGDVWVVYNDAMPRQLIWLAMAGAVLALIRGGFYQRAVALLLPLSFAVVLLVGWYLRTSPLFAQLEGPRLIPMLRPATIFLAALGAHALVHAILRLLRARHARTLAGLATALFVGLLYFGPRSPIPTDSRGLPWLRETTSRPEFAATARSAYLLAEIWRPGDKPLAIGSSLSWHSAFWIGAITGQPAFYDDWAWFWRATTYEVQGALADEVSALELPFLRRHGLTLLAIETEKRDLLERADAKPYLQLIDAGTPGGYAIYRVKSPPGPANGWARFERGTVSAVDVGAASLQARGQSSAPGPALLFVNDFPRWRARVNGQPVPIERSADGYITVPVPAGEVTVALTYTTEPAGWIARGLVCSGFVLLGLALAWPRLTRRGAYMRTAASAPE